MRPEPKLGNYLQAVYMLPLSVKHIVWELPAFILTYPYVYAHTTSASFVANLQYFLIRAYGSQPLLNQMAEQ